MDGRILVWDISLNEDASTFNLEKLHEFSLMQALDLEDFSVDGRADPKLTVQIQSICMGNKSILFGTRSGDIYEIVRPVDPDYKESETRKEVNYNDKLIVRLNCNDQDLPKSVAFSIQEDRIFTITKGGIFSVYDRRSLKRAYMKVLGKMTVAMIAFKKAEYLLVAFDNEVTLSEDSTAFKNAIDHHARYSN